MEAKVAERGQVTIPKPLRNKLGLTKGAIIDFEVKDGKLIGRKCTIDDAINEVRGCIDLGMSTDEFMKVIRGKR